MDPALASEMFEAAALELRKAGIRVSKDGTDGADAVLNLTVFIRTGVTDVVTVRMDVEQKVGVVRTGEHLQLVTWYYEDSSAQSSWRTTAKPLALKAINRFLSDWLDANGR